MTSALDRINKSIPEEALSLQCANKLAKWRDKATTGLDKVGRRVVTGAALLPLGIMSVVETTMCLALTILTAPAEIAGLHFSSVFLERAYKGAVSASVSFILFPISNIFRKKIDSIGDKEVEAPFSTHGVRALGAWRFKSKLTNLDRGMRTVAMGAALPVLGVLGYVEAIMSLALGILTAPVAIIGFTDLSKAFFRRAYAGAFESSSCLTVYQLLNLNIKVPRVDLPKYKSLQRVYRVIKTPLSQRAARPLKKWRNRGAPGMDKTVRTIVRGVALGALEITSIIESITSFALGLLTAPAEIVGIGFSTRFLERSHALLRFRRLV